MCFEHINKNLTTTTIPEDAAGCSSWLTYWTAYSLFAVFEKSPAAFFCSWVPYYPELKLGFVIWLVLPRFQGAARIYDAVIAKWFLQYEADIDAQVIIMFRLK